MKIRAGNKWKSLNLVYFVSIFSPDAREESDHLGRREK